MQRVAEAVALAPTDASLRYVQGLMLAGAGQRDGAVTAFREAERLGAGTPLAARATAHLRALATPARRP